jgi:peptidyl-prolyl cis-trans isomerase B (cyclophilin B)
MKTKNDKRFLKSVFLMVLISSLALGGCATKTTDNTTTNVTPTQETSLNMKDYRPRLEGKATVIMTVNGSPITIEIDGENAPITAGNFVDLVERGVYDGLVFHRVVKSPQPFVAQGGDPQGKDPKFPISALGTSGFVDPATGQKREIPLEIKLKGNDEPTYSKALGNQQGAPVVLPHRRGAIAMARSQAPNSASSQFYFALADLGFLDGDYAVFGYVTSGMEVVDAIKQGDRIDSAKVAEGLENLKK